LGCLEVRAQIFNGEPEFFWSPINTIEDVVGDEQFHASGGIIDVPDGGGTLPMIATPVDFGGTPWAPRWVAPGLGEHTDEVLAELKVQRAR
jgi:crotonobetainyl-CoA:carnitine CoA-transferase CaiB-like acyl-CoA transferase